MLQPNARELLDNAKTVRYRAGSAAPTLEALASRVDKVLALHIKNTWDEDPRKVGACAECARDWPCPTVRTLEGEEE